MHATRWLAVAWLVTVGVLALPAAEAQPAPVEVGYGAFLLNVGNYDVAKGTYTADLYLWFRWDEASAPANFTPANFEFMNGRATSRERILDQRLEDGTRELWFRVHASLYSTPNFDRYPFDRQRLVIAFEDTVLTRDALVYVPLAEGVGLSDDVGLPGWRVTGWGSDATRTEYPFGDDHSRGTFSVTVRRETLSVAFKTFVPPIVFAAVSGLSFLFVPAKIAQRIALGSGMLITSVLFHISQTASLPPLGQLILFDKVMIAFYAFLALSLAVTTMIAMAEDVWKKPERIPRINRAGLAVSLVVPVLVFLLLELV